MISHSVTFGMTMATDIMDLISDYARSSDGVKNGAWKDALKKAIKHLVLEVVDSRVHINHCYKFEKFTDKPLEQLTFEQKDESGRVSKINLVDHWNTRRRKEGKSPLKETRLPGIQELLGSIINIK